VDSRWSPDRICRRIEECHRQFGAVEVHGGGCTNLDFADLIRDTSCDSLLYLDPPYYGKGNELYEVGFSVEDHERLASALAETKHHWVLSYDDCYAVRKLYHWACLKALDVKYSITTSKDRDTGQRLSRTGGELLIYPKAAAEAALLCTQAVQASAG
jgi:DNA adenine methylase